MASRNQRAVTDVPPGRWAEFGRALLDWRENELGYRVRGRFAADRGINIRLVQDLENNYRPGTYTRWALERDAARAYEITYESMLAFLHGETDTFTRVSAHNAGVATAAGQVPPPAASRALPPAPPSGLIRDEAVYPWAVPIWARILDLVDRGVTDPSGADLGLDPDDADVFDGSAGLSLSDRAWLTGDVQRRRAARNSSGRREDSA